MKQLRQQSGFSLIELMIGLAIGLFILLGVVMVYVSSVRSQTTNDSLARVQESGRFATYLMAREIRQVGFSQACPNGFNNLLDQDSGSYEDALFDLDEPLMGWNDRAGDLAGRIPDYVTGDVILVKHAAQGTSLTVKASNPVNAAAINVNENPTGIPAGSIVMTSDAFGCDLFQKSNNENAASLTRGAGGTPGNLNNAEWSHEYDETLDIFRYTGVIFYIGTGSGGRPALKQYRVDPANGGAPGDALGRYSELVSGVEDMQLRYGIDADGNGEADTTVDNYVTADAVADWSDVVSVQISLLAASPGAPLNGIAQDIAWPFDANGDGANDPIAVPADNRLRSVFTTSVAIRNRLP